MANAPSPQAGGHPHLRRTLIAATASVSAFIMVIGAVSFGAYFWTRSQIRVIPDFTDPSATAGSPTPAPYTGKCAEKSCNYLLLGSDSRAGLSKDEQVHFGTNADIGGSNRSDTIMLIHTVPDEQKAVFLSFPRDLWTNIPGVGEGKINSAFEGGIEHNGAQKVAATVHELTGMPIDHIMYVDLAGFQGLVDALGGVEMCVPFPMQDELTGLDIQSGCQHFDGFTALAYVRTRHQPCDTIPDFARISRQQQFLRAVIAKLLQPSELLRLPTLVPALLDNLVVDRGLRNPAELAYLVGQLKAVGTDAADFRSVPTIPDGIYVNGTFLSIVRAIEPDANQLFAKIRTGAPLGDLGLELEGTPPSPANIRVGVYDKRSLGAASPVEQTYTAGGFDTSVGIRDASALASPVKGSVILFANGQEAMAKVVQDYYPNLEIVVAPHGLLSDIDVAVVITSTFTPPPPATGPPVCG
jgi:LCP family protein required for cell wall assembly